MRSLRLILRTAILLSLCACIDQPADALAVEQSAKRALAPAWPDGPPISSLGPVRQYTGIFKVGFEANTFVPDGGSECWAVQPASESRLVQRVRTIAGGRSSRELPVKPIRVTWLGRLSGPGSYGHLGSCVHTLLVTHVIDFVPLR